jgi:hypothetical protein
MELFQEILTNLFSDWLGYWLPWLGAAVIAYLKAHGKKWIEPAVYALVGFAAIQIAIVGFRAQSFMAEQRALVDAQKPIADAKLEEVLKGWATNFRWGTRPLDRGDAFDFAFEITVGLVKIPMSVGKPKSLPGYVTVGHTVLIGRNQQEALSALSPQARATFMANLRLELARTGKSSSDLADDTLDRIILVGYMPTSRALSDADFLAMVNDVNNARAVVSQLIVATLGPARQ